MPSSQLEISKLYRRHVGEKAVLVGNGPSLDISKLDQLGEFKTFAFNKIFLAFNDTIWRPDFYLVNDKLVAQQNRQQILDLSVRKIFAHSVNEELNDDADAIFVGPGASSAHQESRLEEEKFQYWKDFWVPPDWNPLTGMRAGNSVTNFAIKMAFWMGFDEVYAIGLDHRFSLDPQNDDKKVFGNSVLLSEGASINHFSPDYRPAGEKWTFPQLALMAEEFDRAREVYESAGRKLFNATKNSDYNGWEYREIPFGAAARSNSPRLASRDEKSAPQQIKVSAVITVFNQEKTIRRAIESAINQTQKVLEVIIVNDCSSDGTFNIIEDYSKKWPKVVKVINHERNLGQGAAFASAFKIARGDYLAFLDSDDYWHADKIQKLQTQVTLNESAILFQQNLRVEDETNEGETRSNFRNFVVSGDLASFMKKHGTLGELVPTSGLTVCRGAVSTLLPELLDFRISADGLITRVCARIGPVSSSHSITGTYSVTGANNTFNNASYSAEQHLNLLVRSLKANYVRAGEASLLPNQLLRGTDAAEFSEDCSKKKKQVGLRQKTKRKFRDLLEPVATKLWTWLSST